MSAPATSMPATNPATTDRPAPDAAPRHRYVRATSVDDAVARLREPGAVPIAGGTDLVPLTRAGLRAVRCVVDVGHLPLAFVRVEPPATLSIGAGTTATALLADPLVRAHAPLLAQALAAGASAQVRHRATLAGNLLQAPRCPWFRSDAPGCNRRRPGSGCDARRAGSRDGERWLAILGHRDVAGAAAGDDRPGEDHSCAAAATSDAAVALVALEARVRLATPAGPLIWPIGSLWHDGHAGDDRDESHAGDDGTPGTAGPPGAPRLPAGALVTTIEVPVAGSVATPVAAPEAAPVPVSAGPASDQHAFVKVRDRASFEFAVVSVAASLRVRAGRVVAARLAAGGVAPVPWRLAAVERALAGRPADTATFTAAASRAADGARPLPGNTFKTTLLAHATLRALEQAMEVR